MHILANVKIQWSVDHADNTQNLMGFLHVNHPVQLVAEFHAMVAFQELLPAKGVP